MGTKEIIKLKIGAYELTDGIYIYTLKVGLNKNKSKYYAITEKGHLPFSSNIFITQVVKTDEYGNKYKCLSASAGVGGLRIHSDNIYWMLDRLKFVE